MESVVMNGDFYIIAEVKKDDGKWELIPYMKDKILMQYFPDEDKAIEAGKSLQKLLGEANPCIVKIYQQTSVIHSDGFLRRD
jgi:hypothetical protein